MIATPVTTARLVIDLLTVEDAPAVASPSGHRPPLLEQGR